MKIDGPSADQWHPPATRRAGRRLMASFGLIAALAGAVVAAVPAVPAPAGGARGPTINAGSRESSNQQFLKAKALYDAGRYQEAWIENEGALRLDPQNGDAALLKSILQSKLTAIPETEGAGAGAATGASPAGGAGGGITAGKLKTLTPQQVSIIKLMEMAAGDNTINGRVEPKVLEDFWNEVVKADTTADVSKPAHDAFVRPNNFLVQAHRIRNSDNHKFIDQVSITNDPANLKYFKNNINTYVGQNCATSECHGGEKAGAFRLIPPVVNNDANIYTNFYILNAYANKSGKMLDRDNPEASLLLQYSLPKALAKTPHPGAVDFRHFANTNDPRLKMYMEWLKSLAYPKPNYGFTLPIPGMAALPASASAPASGPTTATRAAK